MSQYKQMIADYFEQHKQQMLSSLAEIVAIDSSFKPCGDETKPFGEGSAAALAWAQAFARDNGFKTTNVDSQAAALMEVAAGTSDAAIIDSLMAAAMVGEGTSYDKLTYTVGLNNEEYGVGFRKGSDLKDELNAFLKSSYEDGSMKTIAEKYGVQAALKAQ